MPDRPTLKKEIEVTPAMLEAGADAVRDYDGGYMEPPPDAAERIYRAMEAVRVAGLEADRAETGIGS